MSKYMQTMQTMTNIPSSTSTHGESTCPEADLRHGSYLCEHAGTTLHTESVSQLAIQFVVLTIIQCLALLPLLANTGAPCQVLDI